MRLRGVGSSNGDAMRMRWFSMGFVIGVAVLPGCGDASTETIQLTSRTESFEKPEVPVPKKLLVGDLLVVDARPLDDDKEQTSACSAASSSDPSVLEVKPIRGNCRLFVLLGKRTGHVRLSFSAGEVRAAAELDVLSAVDESTSTVP